MSLLRVENLGLAIGETPILEGVSFAVEPGEVVGLVGESGSGKSMTALSVLDLLPHGSRRTGRIVLDGRDLTTLPERDMVRVRGGAVGMVFQEPMTALNPVMTIGDQVAEVLSVHRAAGRREAHARAADALARVGLPHETVGHDRYPHELSGGQRQRVGIAMATVLKPKLLIADEPTTALDVTTQAQVLSLLRDLVAEEQMGLVLITHDLAVVAQMADRLVILEKGRVVEEGAPRTVFTDPQHAYTRKLIAASAHVPQRAARILSAEPPLLAVENLVRRYPMRRAMPFGPRRWVEAVRGVSLTVAPGESVGIVGESGSGKSTLARAILGLERPDAGRIGVAGRPVDGPRGTDFATRQAMQIVFQDPYGSFDPRQTVEKLVAEPFHLLGASAPRGAARRAAVSEALQSVGLSAGDRDKYIFEFSGGQRQRIAIARALIVRPRLVVLDEPVSALDVTVRAQILDLLADLQARYGLAYLFIAHDLGVVRAITDRVLVMHEGAVVEEGPTQRVLDQPDHPYTRALVAATPRLEAARARG